MDMKIQGRARTIAAIGVGLIPVVVVARLIQMESNRRRGKSVTYPEDMDAKL